MKKNNCIKKCYRSKSEAKKKMKYLNKIIKHSVGSIYYCDTCSNYHLTSFSKDRSRRIKN